MSHENVASPHPEDEEPDLDFGLPLGAALGVVAYSNLDDYYFSGERNYCQGVFTGYKYQCVEFARRVMLLRQGCIFGQCGPAHEIFDMTEVTNVHTGAKHKFVACPNGTTKVKPQTGMTLIYPIDKKMPVGHVAVFGEVGDDWAGIAEENEASKAWNGKPYGRKVQLKQNDDGSWLIIEPDPHFVSPRGWLYIEGVEPFKPLDGVTEEDLRTLNAKTFNEKVYPQFPVLPEFLAPPGGSKKLAHFTTPVIVPKVHLFNGPEDRPRVQLQKEYLDLVEHHLHEDVEKLGQQHPHHVPHAEKAHHAKRAAARRVPHYQSVYSPNEELGVASIGQTLRGYKVVECFVIDLLAEALTNETKRKELAARYELPEYLLLAAAKQVGHAAKNTAAQTADVNGHQIQVSRAVGTVDFALGTMGLAFEPETKRYLVAHAEFDSLAYLIDINACQDTYAEDAGFSRGWRMTNFGNDFHRFVKNFFRFKLHIHNADRELDFVDFGSSADLVARGVVLSAQDQYHYDIERIQGRYVAAYLQEYLQERKKEFDNGDIPEDDLPKWTIRIVNFFDSNVTIDTQKKNLLVDANVSHFIFKTVPWAFLIKLAETGKADKVQEFLTSVCCSETHPVVFQPVWTHIASHTRFLHDLAVWAEKEGANRKIDGVETIQAHVIESKYWPHGADGPCTYKIHPIEGAKNPKIMGQPYNIPEFSKPAVKGKELAVGRSGKSYPILHSIVIHGKRSAGFFLEARTEDEEHSTLAHAVHPAPMIYMPWAIRGEDAPEE